MTSALDRLSLFEAMDLAADLLRAADPCGHSAADDQIAFRNLQRRKFPGLDGEQFQVLFSEWRDRYAGKCALDRSKALADLTATIDAQASRNPPSPPFKCVCGTETHNPADPDFMKLHMPHCHEASEARWRARQNNGGPA